MTVLVEILLTSPELPLVELAGSLPSREIGLVQIFPFEDGGDMLTLTVDDESYETFESELPRQRGVTEVTELGATADGWLFKVTLDADASPSRMFEHGKFETALMRSTITTDGWRERKVFLNYDEFNAFRKSCNSENISTKLVTISAEPGRTDEGTQPGLTERQYEALVCAFSRGYYESPRRVSTATIGEDLGISAASVSELLRRAERQLVSQTVDVRSHLNTRTD
ncbi:helix-turn-helix domain-containing protein [Haladaptatus sp. AB618]|uniref:helix-turn-helix domain-containing protein n=1 Tax=Haladaptatus sp. AB618 TaxID=2934173 RepID=UPI00209BE42D|nr:helix-turn-helix domain-containing protein [Haladaptatus sp. AB618]MCO8253532.1 helix-turn-helix domain-containing protein [Haladaptatus sp. AB618]